MRVWSRGTDDENMRPYEFSCEGPAVGINDKALEVVIELQDLTKTVMVYMTFAEAERVYNFCKQGRDCNVR